MAGRTDALGGVITIACVRQGTKYGPEYVERLRNMAARHIDREFRFICLTDRPQECPDGIEAIDISAHRLKGWWAKLCLFSPAIRGDERTVYFDLDTVIAGPLDPLLDLDVEFGICANFTRERSPDYPCRYGSCVMTFAPGFGGSVWSGFRSDAGGLMASCGTYGDQLAIERLWPAAALLQDCLPGGFFLGRRDIGNAKPDRCSVVVFAGSRKPHNAPQKWIRDAWR